MFAPRPHLSAIAIVSFIISFIVARAFTTFFPSTVFISSGIHIHHFWYGIALVAIGGWLGISYNDKDVDRLAAILYGAGGGLIVDEAGLLLTFGDYWTGLTFSVFVVLLAFAFVLFLLYSYRQVLLRELGEFGRSRASLYFAVFLFAVSIAFFTETTDLFVTTASGILAAISILIVAVSLILRRRKPI